MNIQSFCETIDSEQAQIIGLLHPLWMELPGVSLKFNFKLPFYYRYSWVGYLNPLKKGGVELAFVNGVKIDPEGHFLISKERKQISGITLNHPQDIDYDVVKAAIHLALEYDENHRRQPKR